MAVMGYTAIGSTQAGPALNASSIYAQLCAAGATPSASQSRIWCLMFIWPQPWPDPVAGTPESPVYVYSLYATYADGLISKFTASLGKTTAGDGYARAALYTSGGVFVGESDTLTVPGSSSAAWRDLPCSAPVPIAAGVDYIMAVGMTEMVFVKRVLLASYDPASWYSGAQALAVTDRVSVGEPVQPLQRALTVADSVTVNEFRHDSAPCWGRYIKPADLLAGGHHP